MGLFGRVGVVADGAGERRKGTHGLSSGFEALPFRLFAKLAEAGYAAIYQSGVDLAELPVADAQRVQETGVVVLYDNVHVAG